MPLRKRDFLSKTGRLRIDRRKTPAERSQHTFLCLQSSHLRRMVRKSRLLLKASSSGSDIGGGDWGRSRWISWLRSRRGVKDMISYETDIGLRCLLRGLSPLSPALSSSLYCSYWSLMSSPLSACACPDRSDAGDSFASIREKTHSVLG